MSQILDLIQTSEEPMFIIAPTQAVEDADLEKIYNILEDICVKLEEKTDVAFNVLVDDASLIGGYEGLNEGEFS